MEYKGDFIEVFAPGTVANVACGFDVLGFALEAPGDVISISKTDNRKIEIIEINGAAELSKDIDNNVVGVSVKALLDELGSQQGLAIKIEKGVKPGSGIGSSAASSAGAVVAANKLLNAGFNDVDLIRFAMEGERLASGVAHADNVAPAILGGFTLVRSYNPLDIIKLNAPSELFCAIVHPQIEVKTADARSVLRINLPLKKAVIQWGNVGGLVAGLFLEDYALIGRSLHDEIIEPIRSILIPAFNLVKSAAMDNGALGCSISGSGPSIFALCKGLESANFVANAMGKVYDNLGIDNKVYVSGINKTGARLVEL
jgi:homoserine kinase